MTANILKPPLAVGCSKQDDFGANPKSKHASLLWANHTVGLCFTYLAAKKAERKVPFDSSAQAWKRGQRSGSLLSDPGTAALDHWARWFLQWEDYFILCISSETPEISIGRSLPVEHQFKLKGKSQFESILKVFETLFALESERLVHCFTHPLFQICFFFGGGGFWNAVRIETGCCVDGTRTGGLWFSTRRQHPDGLVKTI